MSVAAHPELSQRQLSSAVGRSTAVIRKIVAGHEKHGTTNVINHGGERRDTLKPEGREILRRLITRFPKKGDVWYASMMTTILGRKVSVSVINHTCNKRIKFSLKKSTNFYSECAPSRPPNTTPPSPSALDLCTVVECSLVSHSRLLLRARTL